MNSMRQQLEDVGPLRSIPEAAPRLGMTPKGVWGLVARREIESVKVGRLRRISDRAIREFIQNNTVPTLRDCQ